MCLRNRLQHHNGVELLTRSLQCVRYAKNAVITLTDAHAIAASTVYIVGQDFAKCTKTPLLKISKWALYTTTLHQIVLLCQPFLRELCVEVYLKR